jgi:hypothetical protein
VTAGMALWTPNLRASLKENIDRYPQLADDTRELFPALVQMDQAEEDRRE